jgi:hypothetical protein
MNQIQIQELKEQTRNQAMLERAQKIVSDGKVKQLDGNHWLVNSSSEKTPGLMYSVLFDPTLDFLTCSYPHHEHRLEYCKHILAVALFFGKEPET